MVVPQVKQVRTQLNSVAAFARPDGPDGGQGLDATLPPPIVNFHKGCKGCMMTDARLGRLFGRRIENELWRPVWTFGRPVLPNAHAINNLLTLATCTLRSGQYRETKPWSRGVNPTPPGTIRPFIRHPPKTDAGRFSTRAIKDIAISMWGSVEEPTFGIRCLLTRLLSFKLFVEGCPGKLRDAFLVGT